ncbi:MAG: hypothetical protein HQM10_21645 [Candidatus Riflebacteria bacterium]|nr:hypothetical protein [Candidatus Riflebacteria bacterium]
MNKIMQRAFTITELVIAASISSLLLFSIQKIWLTGTQNSIAGTEALNASNSLARIYFMIKSDIMKCRKVVRSTSSVSVIDSDADFQKILNAARNSIEKTSLDPPDGGIVFYNLTLESNTGSHISYRLKSIVDQNSCVLERVEEKFANGRVSETSIAVLDASRVEEFYLLPIRKLQALKQEQSSDGNHYKDFLLLYLSLCPKLQGSASAKREIVISSIINLPEATDNKWNSWR